MASMTQYGLIADAGTLVLGGDLPIRRLGFGAMNLLEAGLTGTSGVNRANAIDLLRDVAASGVNFIDTGDAYGTMGDEDLIAAALYPYRSGLVIATKGGSSRGGAGRLAEDGHPDRIKAACEASLSRLRRESIDLYQFHAVDPRIPLEESVGALANLRAAGKIRHIGIANVTRSQVERALTICPIAAVLNRYNLWDRSCDPVLEFCERQKIAFIPWYPLATGMLAHAGGVMERIAQFHEATPAQIALAWLLARSDMMVLIPGTTSTVHMRENLGCAAIRLSPQDFADLACMA